MSINRIQSDILKALTESETYMKLEDIMFKIKSHGLTARAFQMEVKALISTGRVEVTGKASNTKYIINNELQRQYPSSEFLYVYKDNNIIGQFFKIKNVYRFYYDNNYLANYSSPIATIDLSIEPYDFDEIPAIFEDNMPEGINREILETSHKIADEFEILNVMNDSIGDLCFSKFKEKCYIEGNKASGYLSNLEEILSTNPKINVLEDFFLNMSDKELFPENEDLSSYDDTKVEGISGFQYKRFANIDFEKKEVTLNDKASTYILKPYSKIKADENNEHYYPHLALNEHLHISFAKNELGFRVPYSAIVKQDGAEEYHYIIKRFDRLGINRFAKTSFAAFLGLRSENKYDTTSEKMFKRIAKELISPKERKELLKHYVYSVIIAHEDLHSKNLSLIFDDGKVLFSPLYDMCATEFYDNAKGYESHLTINGKRNNIRPNDFKPLCKILNIDFKEFRSESKLIANTFRDNMPAYYDEIEKLGHINYAIRKQSTKRGNTNSTFKKVVEHKEFVDVLRDYHKRRVDTLTEHGWLL